MRFIGDIHGNFLRYSHIIRECDSSLQLGDFGVGFPYDTDDVHCCNYTEFDGYTLSFPPKFDLSHKWIRGNHDWPKICKKHDNYLGDYGYLNQPDLFFISGAYSIDKEYRTIGIDWWPEEEISVSMLQEMIQLYTKTKPKIVVSHDGPTAFVKYLFQNHKDLLGAPCISSRTQEALNRCWEIHQPDYWIFAHYHVHMGQIIGKTRFQCVGVMRTFDIKNLTW
ncbi:MAG: metallophosphoesterase [Elusimicrobiota bacterium]